MRTVKVSSDIKEYSAIRHKPNVDREVREFDPSPFTFEQFEILKTIDRLHFRAYRNFRNQWAIGYGHIGEVDGRPVNELSFVNEAEACRYLLADLTKAREQVLKFVTRPINSNQTAALSSLISMAKFKDIYTRAVWKRINLGDHVGAAALFNRYTWYKGKQMVYLVRRREIEANLFCSFLQRY